MNMQKFIKERDEALLSLNKEKIMSYMKKYNIDATPTNDSVFWSGIHKAIISLRSATKEQKNKSLKWLKENGFKCY